MTTGHSDRILLPGPGVATEAGNVGTAIDYRLRLAFTAAVSVDPATRAGISLTGTHDSDASRRMRRVGEEWRRRCWACASMTGSCPWTGPTTKERK